MVVGLVLLRELPAEASRGRLPAAPGESRPMEYLGWEMVKVGFAAGARVREILQAGGTAMLLRGLFQGVS